MSLRRSCIHVAEKNVIHRGRGGLGNHDTMENTREDYQITSKQCMRSLSLSFLKESTGLPCTAVVVVESIEKQQ